MSVMDWLPKVAAVFALDDGRGGLVRSVHMFEADRMPEAVGEEDVPLAISYVEGFAPRYSRGGPQRNTWRGWTELYLTRNLDKASLPLVAGFADKILTALAGNVKLSGTAVLFAPVEGELAIEMPVALAFGSQAMHYGAIVHWTVIEDKAGLSVTDPSA